MIHHVTPSTIHAAPEALIAFKTASIAFEKNGGQEGVVIISRQLTLVLPIKHSAGQAVHTQNKTHTCAYAAYMCQLQQIQAVRALAVPGWGETLQKVTAMHTASAVLHSILSHCCTLRTSPCAHAHTAAVCTQQAQRFVHIQRAYTAKTNILPEQATAKLHSTCATRHSMAQTQLAVLEFCCTQILRA